MAATDTTASPRSNPPVNYDQDHEHYGEKSTFPTSWTTNEERNPGKGRSITIHLFHEFTRCMMA